MHPLSAPPPESIRNRKVIWCFQGVEKSCIGNVWVNKILLFSEFVNSLKRYFMFEKYIHIHIHIYIYIYIYIYKSTNQAKLFGCSNTFKKKKTDILVLKKAGFVQLIFRISFKIVVPNDIFLSSWFFDHFQGTLRIVPLGDNIKIRWDLNALYVIVYIWMYIMAKIYVYMKKLHDTNMYIQ